MAKEFVPCRMMFGSVGMSRLRRTLFRVPPYISLALALLLTAFATLYTFQLRENEAHQGFERLENRLMMLLQSRVQVYLSGAFEVNNRAMTFRLGAGKDIVTGKLFCHPAHKLLKMSIFYPLSPAHPQNARVTFGKCQSAYKVVEFPPCGNAMN